MKANSPLQALQEALRTGEMTVMDVARRCVERANSNASRNTYIRFEPQELLRDASRLETRFADPGTRPELFGVPISLKDCFDQAGMVTSCGSRFYAGREPAREDSAMATALHAAGALITGKTHLHPLAYGITGQNPEYGDCLQPRDASLLTGGSSSGAAASVQEGSAIAAIGTDTGGSVRVPAALCGLAGYRTSQAMVSEQGWWVDGWRGGAHLAASFDTLGLLTRDLRDLPLLAQALFRVPATRPPDALRIGCVAGDFLRDAEPAVVEALAMWKSRFADMGVSVEEFAPSDWADTYETFAAIQASEAAVLHGGRFDHFEGSIRDRLQWGASLSEAQITAFHSRRLSFCESSRELFARFDLLMLPCAPVHELRANADLTNARQIILRYTTPFSLAGLPGLSLPGESIGAAVGTGVQIAARALNDPMLLAFGKRVGEA